MTAFVLGLIVVAAIIAIVAARRRRDVADWLVEPAEPSPTGSTDVSVLRFAIAGSASSFVQRELARITSQASAGALLRDVGLLLRRVRGEWAYGGAVNEPLRSLAEAKQAFAAHVAAAKRALPGAPADDRAVVVVSIVVCAQGELVTVSHQGVGEELRRALEAAAYRHDLVAVDVVWSTCAAGELPARFPELIAIASPGFAGARSNANALRSEIAGSLEGKLGCRHCGGPFPAELVTCPHCGAPAPGRETAA